jgi:uncharacterized protein YbjT (DUF2867 family)
MGLKVAVVGATSQVGREILKTMAERDFPAADVIALAAGRGSGQEVSYGEERVLRVRGSEGFDFSDTDLRGAILRGAIASGSRFGGARIENADFSDALIDRASQRQLCRTATGTNPVSGVGTRESLGC